MSQNDFNIANQGFPSFRSDLNSALQALASTSSGATAPATPYANQLWYDTANDLLKIRNEANSAWITLFAVSADGFAIEDKIVHSGDTNTAIRFPANDTVTVETNGSERFRVSSTGNVGIGTISPTSLLHLSVQNDGGSYTPAAQLNAGTNGPLFQTRILNTSDDAGSESGLLLQTGSANPSQWTITNQKTASNVGDLILRTRTGSSASAERLRITNAGNVGIGTATPATALDVNGTANATNLTRGGSQVYSRDNILGTVTQSSGVPTGAIIQRGSNANGEFVRYADGTQICNVRIAITPVANTPTTGTATLPAAFVAAYDGDSATTSGYTAVATSHASVAALTRGALVEAASTATTVSINILRSNTTVTNNSVMCIGRWF
jgi:hypothetical protein